MNRTAELASLDALAKRDGLVVLFGRRRIGKTALLTEWLGRRGGLYSQAIEGGTSLQLGQIYADLAGGLDPAIEPKSWPERVLATTRPTRAPQRAVQHVVAVCAACCIG